MYPSGHLVRKICIERVCCYFISEESAKGVQTFISGFRKYHSMSIASIHPTPTRALYSKQRPPTAVWQRMGITRVRTMKRCPIRGKEPAVQPLCPTECEPRPTAARGRPKQNHLPHLKAWCRMPLQLQCPGLYPCRHIIDQETFALTQLGTPPHIETCAMYTFYVSIKDTVDSNVSREPGNNSI